MGSKDSTQELISGAEKLRREASSDAERQAAEAEALGGGPSAKKESAPSTRQLIAESEQMIGNKAAPAPSNPLATVLTTVVVVAALAFAAYLLF